MTHIMKVDEHNKRMNEKLDIKPIQKDNVKTMFANQVKDYSMMVWIDYSIIEGHFPKIVEMDTDGLLEDFASEGEYYLLVDFLEQCKNISEKLGVEIEIEVSKNETDPGCSVSINGVGVGSFIMANAKQNLNVLRSAVNAGKMDMVKVE